MSGISLEPLGCPKPQNVAILEAASLGIPAGSRAARGCAALVGAAALADAADAADVDGARYSCGRGRGRQSDRGLEQRGLVDEAFGAEPTPEVGERDRAQPILQLQLVCSVQPEAGPKIGHIGTNQHPISLHPECIPNSIPGPTAVPIAHRVERSPRHVWSGGAERSCS